MSVALGAALQVLAACNDDIACVFTTGCQDNPGGPGPIATEGGASLPSDGQWIQTGLPRVERSFPTDDAASTTPVVLVFNETMNQDSLDGAFVISTSVGDSVATGDPVLVGDGRVLLLLPTVPLEPGDYVVRATLSAMATDLTGQSLSTMGDLTSFTVADTDPTPPALVATYPQAGADDASQTGEIVVVFDRAMDPDSVSASSFDVTVGGADPMPDPLPQALVVDGDQDPRVFLYRSIDTDGLPVRLGSDLEVELALSTGSARLSAADGELLPATTVLFQTAPFPAPLSAGLLSTPPDAIGIANLEPGPDELLVQVDVADAQEGDFVDLIFFGNDPAQPMQPELLAFLRSVQLTGPGPIGSATFLLPDVDLTTGSSADTARVADGALAFAFRQRRGAIVSPLRVLDADPARSGIQDLLLDTQRPEIVELFEAAPFRSDQRGLVLVGRASELVDSAEVQSDVGDNLDSGVVPPVVGADAGGSFVTAPVGNAILPPGPIACEVIVYDVANNASAPVSGSFSQHGAVGPGAFAPGDPIAVEVFDARSLLPLAGARVITHADAGNGVDFPFTAMATTVADGSASVVTAAAAGTLLSVDLAGYDLFTLQGVASSRLSIGLWPIGASASASISGEVTTESPLASLFLFLDLKVSDSRLPLAAFRTFDTLACQDPFGSPSCDFLPQDVRPAQLGAASVIAGNFLIASAGAFAADELVQGFELSVPRPATASGAEDAFGLVIPFLFQEPGLDSSELPIEFPATLLDASAVVGVDLGMLDDDASTTGAPHVTLETLVPGVGGSLVVGLGLAFGSGGDMWDVRAAHPGAVTSGFFASQGTVDPDLFLRAELRDTQQNRTLRRPRASALAGLPMAGSPAVPVLAPVDVPGLALAAVGGPLGTDASLDLTVSDVLPDALGQSGLYEVRLTDGAGRAWHLWRADAPDGPDPLGVHVPDLTPAGGSQLAAGDLAGVVELWGWPGLDPAAFLWSDLEREHDVFASAAAVTIDLP